MTLFVIFVLIFLVVAGYLFIHCLSSSVYYVFFFFNDTATTEIYTLSLHDALPILDCFKNGCFTCNRRRSPHLSITLQFSRSEEHTSELQSRPHLVCRLLLEKKKNNQSLSMLFNHTT